MEGANLGILTLIPVLLFFTLALLTRKCIMSVIIAGTVGHILYYQEDFFVPLVNTLLEGASNADNNYIVIICLLFGCFVQLLRESKGAIAVGDLARRYVKSEKQVLFYMAVRRYHLYRRLSEHTGNGQLCPDIIRPVQDAERNALLYHQYHIRTGLLIIPISAWVVFFSGIFEQTPEAAVVGDSAMEIYYNIMPYFFYPFLCVLFVLLVIFGIVPKMGGMKKAYKRVKKQETLA